ncbi:MAG: mechanosensitive ion channel family protein [Deltaproteobacteria bacterium]|nr:MAG: mechanosensitive ion channel family protein [Deltaproteobacteria bacterium]
MEHLFATGTEHTGLVLRLFVVLIAGGFFIMWLSGLVRRSVSKKFSAQAGLIVSKAVLYTGVALLLITVLRELGFNLSTLLGAAGIVGIAIGFAAQTSVSNIISGLFLIAEKPFRIDDVISVGNTTGIVLSIDMLSVKLKTFDNKFVRIPNETLIKSELTNITRFPIRRVDIPVGIAYRENIGRVRKILINIAQKEPLCLHEPEPVVVVTGFGSSSVDLLLLAWSATDNWLKAKNVLIEEIKRRFDKEGIEIPFPHISLYTGSETEPFPVEVVSFPKGKDMPGKEV